jgi:hypothetical protein
VTSPFRTIRSGSVWRIRRIAVRATSASFGSSAVNWMSEIVAKWKSLPPLGSSPVSEISGSGVGAPSVGNVTAVGTSASKAASVIEPAFCASTLVLITWKESIEIGNEVVAGRVQVIVCHSGLAASGVP